MSDFGVLSLLPPLLAIVLAFITKNVLFSLFFGVFIGATMLAGWNPILGFVNSIGDFIIPNMADSWNAGVILMTLFVGVFAAMLERGGGATAFGKKMENRIRTRKQAQIAAWIGGLVIFFSDSSNSVLLGPIFKPITDRVKVSREKLAYICDSTAATVPVLIPITAWGAFIMGIMKNHLPDGTNPMSIFMKSVPFYLYPILAILMVFYIGATGWDFGPMKKAEKRSYEEGKVLADGAQPLKKDFDIEVPQDANPTIWDMIIPLVVLVVSLFAVFLWTGGFPQVGFVEAISNSDTMLGLSVAFFLGSIIASIMTRRSKVMAVKEIGETWTIGFSQMIEAILILILSWSIGSVVSEVGTASFIVRVTEGLITPGVMFITIFIAACITSFATGTSWGTFAIFLPIAIPLALENDISVYPAIGAALAGGLFGDHCSPISDSTILASLGASSDHIDHVKTQLPYAIVAAIASVFGYIVAALTDSGFLALVTSIIIMIIIVYVIQKLEISRENKPAKVN